MRKIKITSFCPPLPCSCKRTPSDRKRRFAAKAWRISLRGPNRLTVKIRLLYFSQIIDHLRNDGEAMLVTKEDRRNAFLYCKFRNEQYALYDEYAKSNGILMKTFLVLNALYYAKEGLTQKEICGKTFQSKQTVSLIIKNLLAEGRVVLEENPDDRRNKTIRMTEAGRAYAEKPVRHITRAEDRAMSMFTPQEQEQLIALSRRFTQNLTKLVKGNGEDR